MSNSTTSKLGDKAAILKAARKYKQKEKVPLLVHNTMRWGRKINKRLLYYGPIDGSLPDFGAAAAIEEYHRVVEDDRAGRARRPKDSELVTLADAANVFLEAKAALRDTGELAARTWSDYHATCSRIIDILGKHRAVADMEPADFRKLRSAFANGPQGKRSVVSLGNDIRRSRVFFRFCEVEGLIDRPCRFGTGFDLPSPKSQRLARAAKGTRMFEAHEVRKLLEKADPVVKTWILLGVNCGHGQADLASLPISALDLKNGWIDYGRQKTGVPRRCPLWPETVKALKVAIDTRPDAQAAQDKGFAFLTANGCRLVRDAPAKDEKKREAGVTTHMDTVLPRFTRLLKLVGLNGGRGFYALRHTFLTIAEQTGDFPAVGAIMGHCDASMAGRYREQIGDDRLLKVTNHVRGWLWPAEDDHDGEGRR